MPKTMTTRDRLVGLLPPSAFQVLVTLVVAVTIVGGGLWPYVKDGLGISSEAVDLFTGAIGRFLNPVLTSAVAENAVLIGFWSAVGLTGYLVSWFVYSGLVSARNEVTIATRYTNQGHYRLPWQPLVIKVAGSVMLVLLLASLAPGISIWLTLARWSLDGFGLWGLVGVVIATLLVAVQIYIITVAVQLTFSNWYRSL